MSGAWLTFRRRTQIAASLSAAIAHTSCAQINLRMMILAGIGATLSAGGERTPSAPISSSRASLNAPVPDARKRSVSPRWPSDDDSDGLSLNSFSDIVPVIVFELWVESPGLSDE